MTSSKYKIGIDFHGVITASPAFFRDFTALAFDRDYEVFVISGGPYLVVTFSIPGRSDTTTFFR